MRAEMRRARDGRSGRRAVRRPGERGPLRGFRHTGCAVALLALLPAGAGAEAPERVLDALLDGRRVTEPVAQLVERVPLAADEDFKVIGIGGSQGSSHHLVAIRNAEIPHRHLEHDLLVVMLRGHGSMRLGAETRPVGEGSVLFVPRGTAHAFRNAAATPAVAYAVYWPPFDGKDRVPVEETVEMEQ